MLDTLDARLAQTRDDGLGHLEFLQALCEDEIARRESAALTRRLRRAKFEAQATFEDFDFTANPKLPGAMLRDLAALRWLDAGESVILYGRSGRVLTANFLSSHVSFGPDSGRMLRCCWCSWSHGWCNRVLWTGCDKLLSASNGVGANKVSSGSGSSMARPLRWPRLA
jgi:hypothetical protein